MTSQTFVDFQTVISANWLNDVNNYVYNGVVPSGYVLQIQYGGTGATTAAAARTNLGVAIGTNVQAHNSILDDMSALPSYGLVVHNNVGTVTTRTIDGTTNKIVVTNNDGVGGNVILNVGSDVYTAGGTDVALADGGTGTSLADPSADRMMFWDDSAGSMAWLTPGTNLSITGTTLNATGGGGGSPSGNIGSIQYNLDNVSFGGDNNFLTDGSGGITMTGLTVGNTLISGVTITTQGGNDLILAADGTQAIHIMNTINAGAIPFADIAGLQLNTTGIYSSAGDFQIASDSSGVLKVATVGSGAVGASIQLQEAIDNGTDIITIKAPDNLSSSTTLNLQNVNGTLYSSGGTDVPLTDGGTGASDATTARTNLGVAIGTNVQAFSSQLTSIAGVGDGIVAHTASNTFTPRTITGTTNRITVTNGTGVSGNPTLDVGSSVYTVGGTDVAVTDGGTGLSTMTTAYAPVCAGTTATGALQVASTGLSTAGFVLTSNGSSAVPSFQAVSGSGIIQRNVFTSSGTWTKSVSPVPGTNSMTFVQIWGSGGSGGSAAASFSGGGGGGGGYTEAWFLTSTLSATETITIGAAASVTGTNAGNTGGNTTFGTKLTGFGGGGGCSIASGNNGAGGGGGGTSLSSGSIGATAQMIGRDAGTAGGAGGASAASAIASGFGGGGGGGGTNAAGSGLGGAAINGGGGGGGGAYTIGATGGAGGPSIYGGGGGGGAFQAGATGGPGGTSRLAGAGGTGGFGASAPTAGIQPGGGGGGSTNQASGAGGAGQIIVTVYG